MWHGNSLTARMLTGPNGRRPVVWRMVGDSAIHDSAFFCNTFGQGFPSGSAKVFRPRRKRRTAGIPDLGNLRSAMWLGRRPATTIHIQVGDRPQPGAADISPSVRPSGWPSHRAREPGRVDRQRAPRDRCGLWQPLSTAAHSRRQGATMQGHCLFERPGRRPWRWRPAKPRSSPWMRGLQPWKPPVPAGS
jgi:hypothetical protein